VAVRNGGLVRNKAAHLAVGVDLDGRKQVLGIWIEATEGARFWTRVMGELKARASRTCSWSSVTG
jgi:putative transposase